MLYYLETKIIDVNNVDLPPHFLSEMTMARSKTWAIMDLNRTNAWLDNMIGNNSVVSEWKETSDCLNLPLAFFGGHLVFRRRGNKYAAC